MLKFCLTGCEMEILENLPSDERFMMAFFSRILLALGDIKSFLVRSERGDIVKFD